MKYLSLFSGIGGFELGIGNKAECIGYSEIDKYAIQIYEKHFSHKNYGDIKTIKAEELPQFDLLVGAFRANLFPSQESVEVLPILGELYSSTSPEFLKLSNLAYYFLKTSKGYSLTTKGGLSILLSPRLMSWGMTSNGKCLTARISESPRIGKECSLSDILEEQVDPKYFLSEKITSAP